MAGQGISIQGIILIDLIGFVLIILIVNLVRTRKLHVGYGVIWLLAVSAMMIMISFRPLLISVTMAVGATYPASALSLLAFILIFLFLIFFSVQLSAIAERQVELAQSHALRELLNQESRERIETKEKTESKEDDFESRS
ncbi:MAG: DUF2304 domain-containing protein [Desulfobacterales bacterium]